VSEVTSLGELARQGRVVLNDGYRTRADELGVPGVPILRVAEVQDGFITPSFGDHVHEDFRPKFAAKTSAARDIVVTTKGTVGRVALMREHHPEFVYSPQVCFFRCSAGSDIAPEWLYFWFKGPEFTIQALGVQSQTDMAPYINLADMRSISITVPPMREQRAIAGVLGALDDKIESNRRLVDILRQNARVVAENACSNGERRRLDGIAVFQRGFGYKSSGFAESGRPMISMGCSERRGWLRRDKVRTYGDAVKEKYFVRAEQLLIVNVDLTWKLDVLGWPLLVPPDLDEAIISNDIFGVQFAEGDEWLSWVVWAELQTWSARSVIEGGAKGTTVASVGVDTLGQVEIRIPDSAIGRSTAETMSAFLRRAWTAEEESVQLTTLRDALLPELLSGRLRLRDALTAVEGAV